MGLFSRWFKRSERQGPSERGVAVAGPPTVAPERGPKPVPEEALHTDVESGGGSQIRDRVQYLLDTAINPAVAGHGGMVSLLDVKDNTVYLQMGGGCQGCGAADVTLRQGVERMIREEVPEVLEIIDLTDHAAGQNPYYAASKQ
jgi:Fe-S cluster biogenesis protein NfuA